MPFMTSVVSSNLSAVGYDEWARRLVVEFKGGRAYEYRGVPPSEYRGLLNASSHGGYFARNIRDRYPTRRL